MRPEIIVLIACALIVMAVAGLVLIIALMRIPNDVYRKHQLLGKAVHAANRGRATEGQVKILNDAMAVGMVRQGLAYEEKGGFVATFSTTDYADEMFWSGQYPTQAAVDAELAEFEMSA